MKPKYVAFVFVLYLSVFVGWSAVALYQQTHPMFKRGQCLQGTWDREDWEEPAAIWKIQGVGRNAFRVVSRQDGNKWSSESDSLNYSNQSNYGKVKCP